MNFRLSAACLAAGAVLFVTAEHRAYAQDANRDVVNTKSDVADIVDRVAKRSGEFKVDFDNAVEHSMMDGTKLEDRAKRRADDMHESAKRLKDVFGDKHDKNNPAVREQVDKTLAAGSDLNQVMKDHRFTDKLQHDWDMLKSDLTALAEVYGLSPM